MKRLTSFSTKLLVHCFIFALLIISSLRVTGPAEASVIYDSDGVTTSFCSSDLHDEMNAGDNGETSNGYLNFFGDQIDYIQSYSCGSGDTSYLRLIEADEWTKNQTDVDGTTAKTGAEWYREGMGLGSGTYLPVDSAWTESASATSGYVQTLQKSQVTTGNAKPNAENIDALPVVELKTTGYCITYDQALARSVSQDSTKTIDSTYGSVDNPYVIVPDEGDNCNHDPTLTISTTGTVISTVSGGFTLTGTTTDVDKNQIIKVYFINPSTGARIQAQPTAGISTGSSGGGSGTWTSTISHTTLPEGTYKPTIVAEDNNCDGTTASCSVGTTSVTYTGSVIVDRTAPKTTAAISNQYVKTTAHTTAVTVTASDTGGSTLSNTYTIQRCYNALSNNACPASGYTTCTTLKSDQAIGTLTYSDTTALDKGTGCYKYKTIVTDKAGNSTTSALSSNTLLYDNAEPSATISYSTGYLTAPPAMTLSASDTGGSGLVNGKYSIYRATATLSGGTCGTFTYAASPLVTQSGTSYTDTGSYTSGTCYKYKIVATDNAGNSKTVEGGEIKVDTATASLSCTIESVTGSTGYKASNSQVYYKNTGNGSFVVKVTTPIPASGVSITYPAFNNSGTGASSSSDSGTTRTYTKTYNWTSSTTSSITNQKITITYGNGSSSTCNLSVTYDGTAPTAVTPGYSAETRGTSGSQSVNLGLNPSSFADNTGGSGRKNYIIYRYVASTLSNGTCSNWSSTPATVGTYTDFSATSLSITETLENAKCYKYGLAITDNVGNVTAIRQGAEIKVSTASPTLGIYSVSEPGSTYYDKKDSTPYYSNGSTIYFRPNSNRTLRVTAIASETVGGLKSVQATNLSKTLTSTTVDSNSNYYIDYALTTSTGSVSGLYFRATGNNSKVTDRSFNLTSDNAAPSKPSFTCPSSYQTSTSYTLTSIDWGTDTLSGRNGNATYLQVATASLSNGACQTYGEWSNLLTNPSVNSYTHTVSASNCYKYRVVTADMVGNSVNSDECVVKVDLDAPTSGSITYTSGYIKNGDSQSTALSWSFTDAASGIKEYHVQRGSATFSNNTCPTADTSYTWTNLAGNANAYTTLTTTSTTDTAAKSTATCYRYRVLAVDNAGNPSEYVKGGDIKVDLNVPVNSSLTYTSGYYTSSKDVAVSWGFTDAGGSLLTNTYVLTRQVATLSKNTCGTFATDTSFGTSGSVTLNGATSYTDKTGQTTAHCYRYTIKATDNAGNSTTTTGSSLVIMADFNAPTGTINSTTAPGINAARYITTDGTITINATLNDAGGSSLKSYTLYRGTAKLSNNLCGDYTWNKMTAYTDIGLNTVDTITFNASDSEAHADGYCYQYRIVATDNAGNSNESSTIASTDPIKTDFADSSTYPVSCVLTKTSGSDYIHLKEENLIYYNSSGHTGGFQIAASVQVPTSGIKSVTFPVFNSSGTAADSTSSQTADGKTTNTYTKAYTFANGTTDAWTDKLIEIEFNNGNKTNCSYTIVLDTQAPATPKITNVNGYTNITTYSSLTLGDLVPSTQTDSLSGLEHTNYYSTESGASKLEVFMDTAPLSGGACGTWTNGTTAVYSSSAFTSTSAVTLTNQSHPSKYCYRYRAVLTDNVSNVSSVTGDAYLVSTEVPQISLRSSGGVTGAYSSGSFATLPSNVLHKGGSYVYYKDTGAATTFSVNTYATEPYATIDKVHYQLFNSSSYADGTATTTSDIYSYNYTISAAESAAKTSSLQRIIYATTKTSVDSSTTTKTGEDVTTHDTRRLSMNIVADNVGPHGTQLTCPTATGANGYYIGSNFTVNGTYGDYDVDNQNSDGSTGSGINTTATYIEGKVTKISNGTCTSEQIATFNSGTNKTSYSDTTVSGCYTFTIHAYDLLGNESTATCSFQADVDAPADGAITYTAGYLKDGDSTNTAISWSFTDSATGIAEYHLQRGTASYSGDTCPADDADYTWTSLAGAANAYTTLTTTSTTDTVAKSTATCYRYRVLAVDNASNSSAYVTGGNIKVDLDHPVNTDLDYADGPYTETADVTVSWIFTDAGGSDLTGSYTLARERASFVAAACGTFAVDSTFGTSGSVTVTDTTYTDTSGLDSGYCYRYAVTAYDHAGNSTTTTGSSLIIQTDFDMPTLTYTAPVPGRQTTKQSIIVTSVDVNSGLARLAYTWSTDDSLDTAALGASCTAGTTILSGSNIGSTIPEGTQTLYLCAIDNFGNVHHEHATYVYSGVPDYVHIVDNAETNADVSWNILSISVTDNVLIEGEIPAQSVDKNYDIAFYIKTPGSTDPAATTPYITKTINVSATAGRATYFSITIPVFGNDGEAFNPTATNYTFAGPHAFTVTDTATGLSVTKDYNATFYFPIYNTLHKVNYGAYMRASDYRLNMSD